MQTNCLSAINCGNWTSLRHIFVRTSKATKFLVVTLVAVFCWVGQTSNAIASCGDYLQHKTSDYIQFDLSKQSGGQPNTQSAPHSRCRNGDCRSQDPVPLPTKSQLRLDQNRPEMYLSKFDVPTIASGSSRISTDVAIPSQPAFDVAEPPPRHSV